MKAETLTIFKINLSTSRLTRLKASVKNSKERALNTQRKVLAKLEKVGSCIENTRVGETSHSMTVNLTSMKVINNPQISPTRTPKARLCQ